MNTYYKIKWIAGILLIFVIVLTTNLIDKNNFSQLRDSVVTIYEDRVVASNLIFELTILVQEKEIALSTADSVFFQTRNDKINKEIDLLIHKYEQTKLTTAEQKILNDMKEEIERLFAAEAQYKPQELSDNTKLFRSIDHIVHSLYDLSKVQLDEGKKQMLLSNKVMETVDLFTQLEIILMVIMAVLVQVIVLYKPK